MTEANPLSSSMQFVEAKQVPDPASPMVFDSKTARSGGQIIEGRDIFRVFQVRGFETYGAAFGVAEIAELDRERYREELVGEVRPKFFANLKSPHTLPFRDGVLMVDFKNLQAQD